MINIISRQLNDYDFTVINYFILLTGSFYFSEIKPKSNICVSSTKSY